MAPPGHVPQSRDIPQVVPEPHCQSTPHFAGTQQKPMKQLFAPQPQSFGQVVQFSPAAQMPSPQTGLQVPPWQVVPDPHAGPHVPPQLSEPQVELVHAGEQHEGVVPEVWQTCPFVHAQSWGHDWQFSPALAWQLLSPQLA
jgi:hypothetical protein